MKNYHIDSLNAMYEYGKVLSKRLKNGAVCYLTGDLGAGKTSLVKGIMQGFNYDGAVTSPTYNLVHEYPAKTACVYHIDLYRLNSPEEAFELGLYEISDDNNIVLIEWPEKGQGFIPQANYLIDIRTVVGKADERFISINCI